MATTSSSISPPVAFRDASRVVHAGTAPPGWDVEQWPRQAAESENTSPLLTPSRPILDPYGWMRDETRTCPKVLEHVQAENDYTTLHATAHLEPLRSQLYQDLLSRVQETDVSTPRPHGHQYVYYSRTYEGLAYPVYCRAPRISTWTAVVEAAGSRRHMRREDEPQDDQNEVERWFDRPFMPDVPVFAGEQVLLNVNDLAQDQPYCDVNMFVSSHSSHRRIAYTADYSGDEQYGLYILQEEQEAAAAAEHQNDEHQHETKKTKWNLIHQDPDVKIASSICWGNDNDDSVLFYLKLDATQRPFQLWRRRIHIHHNNHHHDDSTNEHEHDTLLFEESNATFWLSIAKTLDGRYLLVESSSKEETEIRYLDLLLTEPPIRRLEPSESLKLIAPRRDKVLYQVEHRDGVWWIVSNVGGLPNFALFTCPVIIEEEEAAAAAADSDSASALSSSMETKWTRVVDAETGQDALFDGGLDVCVDDVSCFANHVVVTGRQDGLPRIWILGGITTTTTTDANNTQTTKVASKQMLEFEETAYDVALASHYEYETNHLTVTYDSLITPPQSLEIDMSQPNDKSRSRIVLKKKNVPGYDPSLYDCQRTTVIARDGHSHIPVSLVYRKDVMEKHLHDHEPVPVHLYGYGSYGLCVEADWRATRLPLLDHGMIYVIAHVRGGGEKGRPWYEEPNGAKYLCKKNTFYDFVDVASWLIQERKLTTPAQLSCEGRSAGGMLIGAALNEAPRLFRAAILGVPFVDVVCTMIDASIPLTTAEWAEWGNPNEEKFFQYMMEYCPMQNVKPLTYPACLLTGGLHDPRVQYWEIIKFAATLRHTIANDSGMICVKMDMTAGHFSASDRYKYLRELSFDYAFLLDQMGLA